MNILKAETKGQSLVLLFFATLSIIVCYGGRSGQHQIPACASLCLRLRGAGCSTTVLQYVGCSTAVRRVQYCSTSGAVHQAQYSSMPGAVLQCVGRFMHSPVTVSTTCRFILVMMKNLSG